MDKNIPIEKATLPVAPPSPLGGVFVDTHNQDTPKQTWGCHRTWRQTTPPCKSNSFLRKAPYSADRQADVRSSLLVGAVGTPPDSEMATNYVGTPPDLEMTTNYVATPPSSKALLEGDIS